MFEILYIEFVFYVKALLICLLLYLILYARLLWKKSHLHSVVGKEHGLLEKEDRIGTVVSRLTYDGSGSGREDKKHIISSIPVTKYYANKISCTTSGIVALGDELEGRVVILDTCSRKTINEFDTHLIIKRIKITADGRKIIIIDSEANLFVWNAHAVDVLGVKHSGGELLHVFPKIADHEKENMDVDHSGIKVVRFSWASEMDICDLNNYTMISLKDRHSLLSQVEISLDDKTMMTVYLEGVCVLRDLNTGSELRVYNMCYSIQWIISIRDQCFMVIDRSSAFIWDGRKYGMACVVDKIFIENSNIDAFGSDCNGSVISYHVPGGKICMQREHIRKYIDVPRDTITLIKFVENDQKLVTHDGFTIRVYDVDFYPMWTMKKHLAFRDETGECIKFLFISNSVNREKGGKRATDMLPKDVLLYVFSFIKRSY